MKWRSGFGRDYFKEMAAAKAAPAVWVLVFLFLFSPLHAQEDSARADYRLATGDVIYVRVYGEDDLSMRLTVPSDGTVRYAFVGDFRLVGKSIDQVETEIMDRLLGEFLVNPQVSVSIAEFRDFYIQGEVARTGGISWQPGMKVRTAITLAGGLKERASRSRWFLVPAGGGESDRRKVTEDDLVNPGDTLIIEQSFF